MKIDNMLLSKSGHTLIWNKPMTSRQAAKYFLTSGFVAEELYCKLLEDYHELLMPALPHLKLNGVN